MKILYFKDYKWLLSLNKQIRNDFFGYRLFQALAKHFKPFLKDIKVKIRYSPDYQYYIILTACFSHF